MEEQMSVSQIKALLEKKIKEIRTENDRLKKENQEFKETFLEFYHQLYKVDLDYLLQNGMDNNKQSNHYKLIDIGLPSGTLWMDRNIGASSPTDFGLYFAWGETKGYTSDEVGKAKQFSWTDYKYCNGSETTFTKYCDDSDYGLNGYTDNLVTLKSTDDAAYQFTNGKCSMPTKAQIQELIDNTTYEWTTQEGVNGGLFTSKTNGNSIFIPAAGGCDYDSVNNVGGNGWLWSSSLCEDDPIYAWGLLFDSEGVDYDDDYWCYGFPVRGVSKP